MSVQAALELRLPNRACRTFPGTPESVAAVREWIAVELAGTGLPVPDVQLAASELATNAVEHSKSRGEEFLVWVGHNVDTLVRVVVVDDGPLTDQPVDHERSGGRGLRIVHELADEYGSYFADSGHHAAWFEIARPTFPEGD
jgi:anti-sigma regulatory factor (Ser/Thr protein kinase)